MEDIRIPVADESGDMLRVRFEGFLRSYSIPTEAGQETSSDAFMNDYMQQVNVMIRFSHSTVYVNFEHLNEYDSDIAEAILIEYYRFEPYLRHALHNVVASENQQYVYDVDRGQREFFVAFYNLPRVDRIRMVRTAKIGALVGITGTVTRTSEVRPELFYGTFICRKCGTIHAGIEQQFQYTEPPVCKNTQCNKSATFDLITQKSSFIDWQHIRVQENAEEVPAGSMPRTLEVLVRNEAVETAKAGDKVLLFGTIAVVPDTSGLSRAGESTLGTKGNPSAPNSESGGVSGLRKLGVKEMTYKMVFVACTVQVHNQRESLQRRAFALPYYHEIIADSGDGYAGADLNDDYDEHGQGGSQIATLSAEDHQLILEMYSQPQLYNKMAESICPTVFGHIEVKRGVLLMLLGGVHKRTLEKISLRGDLNVCIVGDPSCAKSQFLKYVHGFVPRTVYTAGKSSSAAGLTASVVRDTETGEFCVEAGALMLADNGICCIDEFDKMDSADQVAIHEAMEQQTISITKAGIQATLNARTSVLAAANPVYGRYDRSKTLKANIAISAAIMSRFDLFFVILDECNPKTDEQIARHIVANHTVNGIQDAQANAPFTREQLQKYIAYAKTFQPSFDAKSRNELVVCYRLLRQNDMLGKNKTAYRITVRQLESLIRLSEAVARLHLDQQVRVEYVKEAYRLLQKSIIFVEADDVELEAEEDEEQLPPVGDEFDDDEEAMHAMMMMEAQAQAEANQDNDENENKQAKANRQQQAQAERQEQERDPDLKQPSTTLAPAPAAAAGTVVQPKKKNKVSEREFDEISNLLSLHLRREEENYTGEHFPGVKWPDLINWYLTTHVSDTAAREEKRKIVHGIIRRIIKHGGDIVAIKPVGMSEEEFWERVPSEEKMLKLSSSAII